MMISKLKDSVSRVIYKIGQQTGQKPVELSSTDKANNER